MQEPGAFGVVSTRQPSGVVEVLVVGELDLATAPDLVHCVAAELVREPADVVLALGGVTFMDSTGVVALLDTRRAVEAAGRSLRLVDPSPAVRQVLELTGLLDAFELP